MELKRIDTTANRLRIALDLAGKKQTEIANEAGVDKGALSHYLKGSYEPKQTVINKLASVLNVSEMWLWGYDCQMERPSIQKKADTISSVALRMKDDPEFLFLVETLNKLDADQIRGITKMLSAFLK